MNGRDILTVLLVAAMLVPAASATVMPQQSTASQPAEAADTAEAAASDGSEGNYTRLYVEDGYQSLDLKPGESDSFTVTVENGEDETVTVDPHLYRPRVGNERPVEEEWVSIDAGDTTLDAGEERTFTVNVAIPDDAELGNYNGVVAFTDETIAYPGAPERPVHATSFNVEVYREPIVSILEGDYMYTQIEAGESYTHSIVIENTGDEAVPVDPTIDNERRYHPRDDDDEFERSWVEIDAPNEIPAGETATVNVTISPPDGAAVSDYRVPLNLGINDPARDDRNDYWQRVSLSFQVWEQPDEPFTTDFQVNENTSELTLKLNSRDSRRTDTEPASFDVSFVKPDGTVIDAKRVQTTNSGYVNLAGEERHSDDDGYASEGTQKTFTYRVEDPEAGEWTARITPENTIRFGYEIVRDET